MRRMLTVDQASKEVSLSRCELMRGIHAGIYPALRVGAGRGKFLFDIEMLNEAITENIISRTASLAGKAEAESENIIPFGVIRRVAQ